MIKKIINSSSGDTKQKEKNSRTRKKNQPQTPPPNSFLFNSRSASFFKECLKLETFTVEEIVGKLEISQSEVKKRLCSLVSYGLVTEINYGKDSLYRVQRQKIEKVCTKLLSYLEETKQSCNEEAFTEAKQIQLSEGKIKRFLKRNGRSIAFVDFDDQIGPVLKYKVLSSEFTSKMEKEPGSLAKIVTALSLDAKEITLPRNITLLCKRIESINGEKKRFILIEKMKYGEKNNLRQWVEKLGEMLAGKEYNKENIRNALVYSLKG